MDDIKSITGLSVIDLKQLVQEQEKVALISEQYSQEEKTDNV